MAKGEVEEAVGHENALYHAQRLSEEELCLLTYLALDLVRLTCSS